MKIEIPEALKADVPQNKWGKLLTSTPIVMTVIYTFLPPPHTLSQSLLLGVRT